MRARVIGWLAVFWLGFGLGLLLGAATDPSRAEPACFVAHITGYLPTGNPTADGTPTAGRAWAIVAAPRWLPFGAEVEIDGLGSFEVRDRGLLGPFDLDILVETLAQARALTSDRLACVR